MYGAFPVLTILAACFFPLALLQVLFMSATAMRTWTSILEQQHAYYGFVTRAANELRYLGDAAFEWMQLHQGACSRDSLGLNPIGSFSR